MRNIIFIVILMFFALESCQDKKSNAKEKSPEVAESKQLQAQVELGEKLYAENICNTCHFDDKEDIGPSTTEIVKTYEEQGKSIKAFLKRELEPIVDTNESQVAMMQDNIEAFVYKLSDKEIEAIVAYMEHVAK